MGRSGLGCLAVSTNDDLPPDGAEFEPLTLGSRTRWGLGVFGVVVTGIGAYSIALAGHDGAGSVALVSVGFLSLVLGAAGFLPSRLKHNESVLEWYRKVRRVAETDVVELVEAEVEARVEADLDELPPEVRELIASAKVTIGHTEGEARLPNEGALDNRVVGAARLALEFERRTVARLTETLYELDKSIKVLANTSDDGFDLELVLPEGSRRLVLIKRRMPSSQMMDRFSAAARTLMPSFSSSKSVLLIAESIPQLVLSDFTIFGWPGRVAAMDWPDDKFQAAIELFITGQ